MTQNDLGALEKELRKRRRIAGEWASRLHDLVEDRLPGGYAELPGLAQSTYDACQAWAEAEKALKAAQS